VGMWSMVSRAALTRSKVGIGLMRRAEDESEGEVDPDDIASD